jgi:hypothetical protein
MFATSQSAFLCSMGFTISSSVGVSDVLVALRLSFFHEICTLLKSEKTAGYEVQSFGIIKRTISWQADLIRVFSW